MQIEAVEVGVLCDGTQRVGACVAEGGGIRLRADAEAVENDQKYTFFHLQWFLRFFKIRPCSRGTMHPKK